MNMLTASNKLKKLLEYCKPFLFLQDFSVLKKKLVLFHVLLEHIACHTKWFLSL